MLGTFYTKSFLEWKVKNLSHKADQVFCTLLYYMNYQNGQAWPSQSTIKKFTGQSLKTISLAIRELEKHKVIKTWKTRVEGKQYARMHYQLLCFDGHKLNPPKKLTDKELDNLIEENL